MKQTTLTQIYNNKEGTGNIMNRDSSEDSEVSSTTSNSSSSLNTVHHENVTTSAVKDVKDVVKTPDKPITGVATVTNRKEEKPEQVQIPNVSSRNIMRQGDACTVIIGTQGDRVKATFPALKIESGLSNWYNSDNMDRWTWLKHAECKKPKNDFWERTTTPHLGCYDYVFGSKKYIKKEHKILIGRLDAWGKQTLDLIDSLERIGQRDSKILAKQKKFARKLLPSLLLEIADFTHCSLEILKREVIYRLFDSCTSAPAAELLYMMANSRTFELTAIMNEKFEKYEVSTRFDFDYYKDYASGLEDEERVKFHQNKKSKRKRKK